MALQERAGRKRLKRYDGLGHARALTFSCYHNMPLLRSERACRWTIESIERARRKHGFDLWAYALMPDHAHLLLLPAPDSRMGAVLASIKIPVARRAVTRLKHRDSTFLARMLDEQSGAGGVCRFWQRGGGYDRNLWSARQIWNTIDYIHMNPVRAGVCARPEDWPWSSAAWFSPRRDGPLTIDVHSIPPDPRCGH